MYQIKTAQQENLYTEIFLPAPVSAEEIQKEQLRLIQKGVLHSMSICIKRDGSGVLIVCSYFSNRITEKHLSKTP